MTQVNFQISTAPSTRDIFLRVGVEPLVNNEKKINSIYITNTAGTLSGTTESKIYRVYNNSKDESITAFDDRTTTSTNTNNTHRNQKKLSLVQQH